MLLNNLKIHLGAFCAAAALSAIGATSTDANALFTRSHASSCQFFNGSRIDLSFAVQNDSAASRMQGLCAVTDDDRFPKSSVVVLNLHGNDGNNSAGFAGQVEGRTCRTDAFATAGGCSGSVFTSAAGVGAFTLSPPLVFGVATDFVYAYVDLPVKTGAGVRSTLRGFFTSN
jgi:hypothetical protein